jgi:hypothetical protein
MFNAFSQLDGNNRQIGSSWTCHVRQVLLNDVNSNHASNIRRQATANGPAQGARVYETFGIPLRLPLLVIGLFPGNDFRDAGLLARFVQSATAS